MCFDMVEGANPNNSVIWQAQSSRSLKASSTRMRLSSASALVIFISWRMVFFYISPLDERRVARVELVVKSFVTGERSLWQHWAEERPSKASATETSRVLFFSVLNRPQMPFPPQHINHRIKQ